MISVPVHDQAGKQVGTYDFDPSELAGEINKQLLHDVVVMYETNRRQGTVRTKRRGEVSGSTKKIYKQKGTGRARMGPKRSPIRRGGGHAHALRPKDWSYHMPKKQVRLATRMAVLSKFQDNQVTIVDSLSLSTPKTKQIVGILKALGVSDRSCLLTIGQHDPVIWQSARNIAAVAVSPASDLNAYDILRNRQFVVTRDALDRIRKQNKAD